MGKVSKVTVEFVTRSFAQAQSPEQYRKALKLVDALPAVKPREWAARRESTMALMDAMAEAAERLKVERMSGLPRVTPRGLVVVRGREVQVEVLGAKEVA